MSQRFSASYFFTVALVLSMVLCAHASPHKIIRSAEVFPSEPTITSIAPSPSHIGETVTISGTGFNITNIQANKIAFVNELYVGPPDQYHYDSIPAEIIAVTDTTIVAIVPEGALYGSIYVTVNGQQATSVNGVYYAIEPTVSAFVPENASVGDTITIIGTGFSTVWGAVHFTGSTTFNTFLRELSAIKVIVPSGATTGPVRVSNSVLNSKISTFNFNVTPKITSSPTSGIVGDDVTLDVTGVDPAQAPDYQLTFNGIPAVIKSVYSTAIVATVPFHGTSGPLQLTFKNNPIRGSGFHFTVFPKRPEVTSISPVKGTIGTPIVIRGSFFDQAGPPLTVRFGGDVLAKIDSFNHQTIYTKVPLGAQSGRPIVTSGGRSSDSDPSFRVVETILGMEPRKSNVGDTIVVTGNGFVTALPDYYTIGFPLTAIYPILVTDTTLLFVVPAEASYSVVPTITSGYYLGINIHLPLLTIVPVINRIEPDTLIVGRRMQIEFHGTGFPYLVNRDKIAVIFSTSIVQPITYQNTSKSFVTTVPKTVATGIVPVSVRIDSLVSLSVNLVVLPDTFPYTPLHPEFFSATDVTATSFKCFWSNCYRALGYLLDVSTDNFETFVPGYEALVVTDTSKLISGLEPGTMYEFRLRPYSDTDTASHGNFAQVITIPASPVAAQPIDVTESGFTCLWSSVKGADSYLIEASTDFFDTFISAEVPDTIAIVSITGSLESISYRVKARNYSGMSAYSNIITVVVTSVGDETSQVAFYPNPAKDHVLISGVHEAIKESHVIDTNGKVSNVSLRNVGDNTYSLDIRELPNGLYILQMAVNQKMIQLKFIKQ